ncbi:hypothetical protein RB195_024796 [Necator americanus]|uniref:Uncharacterized protein n=1 Tax=Necator americanus TaxID=51031 RepID=A0ABR1ERS6_NECAM
MQRTVNHYPAEIALAQSECPLTDLKNPDDMVIFAESSAKHQRIGKLPRSCNLQPIDYVYALIRARRCESPGDLQRGQGWTGKRLNSSIGSVT